MKDALIKEPDDLIKFGLIPEFIGRLPIIAYLNELDHAALIDILTQPKNAIIKQYKELFSFDKVDLNFSDSALSKIANKALEKKTGARGLRSIIESMLLDTMFNLRDYENASINITDQVVDGQAPEIIAPALKEKKLKKKVIN